MKTVTVKKKPCSHCSPIASQGVNVEGTIQVKAEKANIQNDEEANLNLRLDSMNSTNCEYEIHKTMQLDYTYRARRASLLLATSPFFSKNNDHRATRERSVRRASWGMSHFFFQVAQLEQRWNSDAWYTFLYWKKITLLRDCLAHWQGRNKRRAVFTSVAKDTLVKSLCYRDISTSSNEWKA